MHEGRYRIHTMDLTLFPHKQWILLLLDRGILGHLSLTESSKNLAGGECYLFLCSLNLSIIDFLVFLAFGVLGIKNYLVFRPIGRLNNIIKSLLYCSFKKNWNIIEMRHCGMVGVYFYSLSYQALYFLYYWESLFF